MINKYFITARILLLFEIYPRFIKIANPQYDDSYLNLCTRTLQNQLIDLHDLSENSLNIYNSFCFTKILTN